MRIACLLLIAALLTIGCRPAAAPVSVSNKPVSVNGVPARDAQANPTKPVAEMSWTTFDGSVQKLKDLNGKVVVLDFWATYCPPCIEEIPHLMELQAKHGPDNLLVVGLHVGGLGANEDPHGCRDHWASRTSSNRRRSVALKLAGTRSRRPAPSSSSNRPSRGAA